VTTGLWHSTDEEERKISKKKRKWQHEY
jgi:hypothetical protein